METKSALIESARSLFLVVHFQIVGVNFDFVDTQSAVETMKKTVIVEAKENAKHRDGDNRREASPHEERPVPGAGFAE